MDSEASDFDGFPEYLLLYSFRLSRLFKRNLGLGIDKGRFGDCD